MELGEGCCSPVGAGGGGGGTGSEAFVGQSWYFAAGAKCCSTCKSPSSLSFSLGTDLRGGAKLFGVEKRRT